MENVSRLRRAVSQVLVETFEPRMLLSGTSDLHGKLRFVPPERLAGVMAANRAGSTDLRSQYASRSVVTKLPPGVQPYSDPNNPQVIGIDKDGLVIQKIDPELDPGDSVVNPGDSYGGEIATSFRLNSKVSESVSVIHEAADATNLLPIGVEPYSDASNPHVIGIDKDGLLIQRINPSLSPGDSLPPTSRGQTSSEVARIDTYGGMLSPVAGMSPASIGGPFNIISEQKLCTPSEF